VKALLSASSTRKFLRFLIGQMKKMEMQGSTGAEKGDDEETEQRGI